MPITGGIGNLIIILVGFDGTGFRHVDVSKKVEQWIIGLFSHWY